MVIAKFAILDNKGILEMKVSSTELQNNFGRYLMLALTEDIIITRNGMPVAKLSALGEEESRRDAVASIVAEKPRKSLWYQKSDIRRVLGTK